MSRLGSLLTAQEISFAVQSGSMKFYDAAEGSLQRLRETQASLRTAISLVDELPTEQKCDSLSKGPLAGVPILVKDLIDTASFQTTYGSLIFKGHRPTVNALSVDRLQRAGAVIVGKANLHEFAWGLTSRNPHWGNVVNPRWPELTPGGSSGGNAAAIASGAVPLGLGTDTAGSLRVPAACCGVVGFKPSYGSVSPAGVFPLSPSLDTIGPIASTVGDCILTFSVLSDQTPPEVDWKLLRVAVTNERLRLQLQQVGIKSTLIEPPSPPRECSFILPYEAWATHKSLVARFADEYDPNVLAKILQGSHITESDYERARSTMLKWRAQIMDSKSYDIVVGTVLGIPIPLANVDEIAIRDEFGKNTRWVNLLGWAAIAIGNTQVTGPSNWEVLAVAERIELLVISMS